MKDLIVKVDAKQFELEESKAIQISSEFQVVVDKMKELAPELENILSLPIETVTCELAGELRKKFVKIRTQTASIHSSQKSFYLRGGKFVDAWKNTQHALSAEVESKLREIETHFERIQKEGEERIQKQRSEEIKQYDELMSQSVGLYKMPLSEYGALLAGAKQRHEQKLADERDAAAFRAEQVKRDAEKAELQRIENEKLKKEAAELQVKIDTERKEAAEKARIERLEKELIQIELQARLEAEAARRRAEERKLYEAEQSKINEAKKADNERILSWITSLEISVINSEGLAPDSILRVKEINQKFLMFKGWAKQLIEGIQVKK